MQVKSEYAKVEVTRIKRTLTPVAFCMRSAEPGNRPDIFAAAECGVMGSVEYLELQKFHSAIIVAE